MAALKDLLPPAKSTTTTYYDHSNDPWFKQRFSSLESEKSSVVIKHNLVPPYLKRAGFVPRKVEDFGDGGCVSRDSHRGEEGPLEFEKVAEEADPFGLDQFLTEVKKGKKALDKVGTGGTMKASAGSSMRDGYEGGSSRTRIGFERGR